jgi:D-glycero-beta-D-manno-heptose 1-phosphate adenylyltransferase
MDPNNLKTLEELKEVVESLRKEGKKIVLTNGCYDIIHKGHVHILQEMAKLGDIFIVAINSDDSVRKFKGFPRPYNLEVDRAFVVSQIKGVDYVVIFGEDDPLEVIRILQPEFHVKGGAGLCERIRAEKELVESYGGEMVCLDLLKGYSSTDIVERIKELERD